MGLLIRVLLALSLAAILISSFSLSISNLQQFGQSASAPRDITGGGNAYIDPYTGDFVGLGELVNDGLDNTPWSNVGIKYDFSPQVGFFENVDTNVSITNPESLNDSGAGGYKGNIGKYAYTYNVPPFVSLPFAVTKQFIDKNASNRAGYLDYWGPVMPMNWTGNWKPADLLATVTGLKPVKTFTSTVNNLNYTRWAVSGTLLNNQSSTIDNVHVVAGLYGSTTPRTNGELVGVAGYGSLAQEEQTAANQTGGLPFAQMDGFEKRNFTLYATIPSDWKPTSARLFAESDSSIMLYDGYTPLFATDHDTGLLYNFEQSTLSPGSNNTITFTTSVINTSRKNVDIDWVLQIVRVPYNSSDKEQYLSKYLGNGTTEQIKIIHSSVKALNGTQEIRYNWHPSEPGWYAHSILIVDNSKVPRILAKPFDYYPITYPPVMYWEVFYYVP